MQTRAGGYTVVSYSTGALVTTDMVVLCASFIVYITGFMLLVNNFKVAAWSPSKTNAAVTLLECSGHIKQDRI